MAGQGEELQFTYAYAARLGSGLGPAPRSAVVSRDRWVSAPGLTSLLTDIARPPSLLGPPSWSRTWTPREEKKSSGLTSLFFCLKKRQVVHFFLWLATATRCLPAATTPSFAHSLTRLHLCLTHWMVNPPLVHFITNHPVHRD